MNGMAVNSVKKLKVHFSSANWRLAAGSERHDKTGGVFCHLTGQAVKIVISEGVLSAADLPYTVGNAHHHLLA